MNKRDLGVYLIIWLMSNVLIWLLDLGDLSITTKVALPIVITVFVILFRVAIFFMIGE